jgi:hypothetical protein
MQATTTKETSQHFESKELHPIQIIRYEDGTIYFGYKPTQLAEKIKEGVVPEPKYLAPPPSRARGWTGQQIIDYHLKLETAQAERAAAAKRYYNAKQERGDEYRRRKVVA